MPDQGELFDVAAAPQAAPVGPAPVPPDLAALAERLPAEVRLGTSSWSFPGWAGIVWDREVGQTTLARHGLAAYARHPLLRAVGVDRSYYGPLAAAQWRAYADDVPGGFRFLVKATRTLVTPGDAAFLHPPTAVTEVVEPVTRGLGAKLGSIVFQLPPFDARAVGGPERFADRLHAFLAALPQGPLYAVEARTPALLGRAWREALAGAGAAHCYTVHPRAAPLARQVEAAPPEEQPAVVARWMLGGGQRYEEARDRYHPFDRLVDEDPAARDGLARLVEAAVAVARPGLVIVNNKAEGSSPLSVFALAARVAARLEGSGGG